jgi:ribosomal-protein-alanine N-acetyltransferase
MTGLVDMRPTQNSNAPVSVVIRPMQLSDLQQVVEIDRLSFSLPWSVHSYLYELEENTDSILYVLEASLPGGEKRVIGCIVVWVVLDEAHIATISVHPQFRGLGFSRGLVQAGLSTAMERGCQSATLEVRSGNLVAQALYRTFGFEVVGVRPRYYRDNDEDALIMTLFDLEKERQSWRPGGVN